MKKTYRCKKCGDLFPDNTDYKHYAICQNTSTIDPEEVRTSFEFVLPRFYKR